MSSIKEALSSLDHPATVRASYVLRTQGFADLADAVAAEGTQAPVETATTPAPTAAAPGVQALIDEAVQRAVQAALANQNQQQPQQ